MKTKEQPSKSVLQPSATDASFDRTASSSSAPPPLQLYVDESSTSSLGSVQRESMPEEEELQMKADESIQREDEGKQDKSEEKSKVDTKVEVVTEHKEGETTTKATTTRSGEEKISPGVTAKASEKTSGDKVTTSAEIAGKHKSSGISATIGIKAEETPNYHTKPDKAKGYFKVGGSWELFDSKVKLDSGITAETDFKSSPSLSVDGKAILFPNGRLTPEIAGKFVLDKEGPSGQITPGLSLKITEMLSAKASVPIDIGSDGKIKPGVGLGLVFKFK